MSEDFQGQALTVPEETKIPDQNQIAEQGVSLNETLTPLEIYRDGPRFYCARVTNGEQDFALKRTTPNPEVNNNPNDLHSPRAHLATEIEMLSFLKHKGSEIAPKIFDVGEEQELAYVTEYLSEGGLGVKESPYFYSLDNLKASSPKAVFDGIKELQDFTSDPDVPGWLTRADRAQTNNPNLGSDDLRFLSEHGNIAKEKVDEAYMRALEIRSNRAQVLSHGEVYPQHIFAPQGAEKAKFIDWENASLGDSLSDHAAVWLRAFEVPEWQNEYYQHVSQQEGFDESAWNANVFLMASGNYWYLSQDWDGMEPTRRSQGAEYCRQTALATAEMLAS